MASCQGIQRLALLGTLLGTLGALKVNAQVQLSPNPATGGSKMTTNTVVLIVVCTVGGTVIILALATIVWLWSKRTKSKGDLEAAASKENPAVPEWRRNTDRSSTIYTNEEYAAQVFPYKELQQATNDFSPKNLIGEGGFGRVYYGKLSDGRVAAVKRLDRGGRQGEKEFRVEVDLLSRLGSPYLLSLWGYCADDEHRVLVYGFMPNGSLQEHLFTDGRPGSPEPLDWPTRLQIALDAARGLEFLHEVAHPTIIHRDFKSSNVLLDLNYRAKVSDFGLAKLSEKGGYVSTRVLGTQGYVAPEYALTGHLTTKSDVYNYGVVLLELITGRFPVDGNRCEGEEVLVPWAMPLLGDRKRLHEIVDPQLEGQYSMKDLVQLAAIANMCVQTQADYRPLIRDVVQSLVPLVKNSAKAVVPAEEQADRIRNADISENFESREFTSGELQAARHSAPSTSQAVPDYYDALNRWSRPAKASSDGSTSQAVALQRRPETAPLFSSPLQRHFPENELSSFPTRPETAPNYSSHLQNQSDGSPDHSPTHILKDSSDFSTMSPIGATKEERRKDSSPHDGWKSTPSGQLYVSRDYDVSELRHIAYGAESFQTPTKRGVNTSEEPLRSSSEHDGYKSTPNGDIYVSRDYDSGEIRLSVEKGVPDVTSSREGLLASPVPY